jgi:hypothetical protein
VGRFCNRHGRGWECAPNVKAVGKFGGAEANGWAMIDKPGRDQAGHFLRAESGGKRRIFPFTQAEIPKQKIPGIFAFSFCFQRNDVSAEQSKDLQWSGASRNPTL